MANALSEFFGKIRAFLREGPQESGTDKQFSAMADERIKYSMDIYVNDDNPMGLFAAILGWGPLRLEYRPGNGHYYYEIIDAIYRYNKFHPKNGIGELYYDTLLRMARTIVASAASLPKLFNVIIYELDNEKKGISPFKIDLPAILKTLKENIKQYPKLVQDKDCMDELRKYDSYFKEHYGAKIL